MDALDWPAFAIMGEGGSAPIVLICEHASCFIPPALDGLGLTPEQRRSHIAWDIGAFAMAKRISSRMRAPLIAGEISRLVYDCNRPFEAKDCIPDHSEVFAVPGNENLTDGERKTRFDHIHTPFHNAVSALIYRQMAASGGQVAVITLHSFTPVYHGTQRDVEIGYLYDNRPALAEAAIDVETERGKYKAAVNVPYSAKDGVTYSLKKHAEARGLPSVMIEVRNDLISTDAMAEQMADHLVQTLKVALQRTAQEATV